MLDSLDLNINYSTANGKLRVSSVFIEKLGQDFVLKNLVENAISPPTFIKYFGVRINPNRNVVISVNILEKINKGVRHYNDIKKSDSSFIEIKVYDIIEHKRLYSMPENYDFKNLKYGYYTDYYRPLVQTKCYWFRECVHIEEVPFQSKRFNGTIRNELGKDFEFQICRVNDSHASITAFHKGEDQIIGFSGAFLWHHNEHDVLFGYWLGRDMLDFQPTLFWMIWSARELSLKCLDQIVNNVRIDALMGIGKLQTRFKTKNEKVNNKNKGTEEDIKPKKIKNPEYKIEFLNSDSSFFQNQSQL